MKQVNLLLLLLILVCFLSSCFGGGGNMNGDERIADATFEKIVDAVISEDGLSITGMFSNAIQNSNGTLKDDSM